MAHLRRHSRLLLRQWLRFEGDLEYVLEHSEPGRPAWARCTDYEAWWSDPQVMAAYVARHAEHQQRLRRLSPNDLVEASRLWRDETAGRRLPNLKQHVDRLLVEASAAELTKIVENTPPSTAPSRRRL
jgi:crotonobetainyl-CoA:carnitine CoA-transferase CaiB-like acyl-CoA transferase